MSYKNFNAWEFARDPHFVEWVIRPNDYSRRFWEAFLSEHPEKAKDILLAKELVTSMDYEDTPTPKEEVYQDLFQRILESKRDHTGRTITREPKPRLAWLKYAATIAMVGTTLFFLGLYQNQIEKKPSIATELVKIESPKGSQITTHLSDGTRVRLNGGSYISYHKPFMTDTSRTVFLVGEAYFEVSEDPSRPFRVASKFVQTEVLGTEFNIQAYPGEKEISVAVAKGKVKVTNTPESDTSPFEHTLVRLQESRFNVQANQSFKNELADESAFAWTKWKLIFEKEPLREVFKKLERWYGVSFEFGSGLDFSETYSGVFDNDPLQVVLKTFRTQRAFDYQVMKNQKVKIMKYKR